MRARNLMLTTLGSGVLLGLVLGVTTNTTMKPPPEPPWRQAARSETAPAPIADTEQQDFDSTWSTADRTPTWKRHPPLYQTADYAIPRYRDYAPPPEPAMADRTETADPPADVLARSADEAATPATPPVTVIVVPADRADTIRAGA
jgi:hypothetical protein